MKSYLIKIYHGYTAGKKKIQEFITDVSKVLEFHPFILGLNYHKGEFFYSLDCEDDTYPILESQFYTSFDNFQIIGDSKHIWSYDMSKTIIAELELTHGDHFPFKFDLDDDTGLMFNLLRSFENLDIVHDKFGYYIVVEPQNTNGLMFFISNRRHNLRFKVGLWFGSYKHMFSVKTQKNRKKEGFHYHHEKLQKRLSKVRLFMICQADSKQLARGKLKSIANNFEVFKNYPLNDFKLKKVSLSNSASGGLLGLLGINDILKIVQRLANKIAGVEHSKGGGSGYETDYHTGVGPDVLIGDHHLLFTPEEIAQLFQFPQNPKNETSLLKVTSKKLSLPIGIPTLPSKKLPNGEVLPTKVDHALNVVGVSDFRSITVPVGIYDEDRLKHTYVIGKTGTGKSKFIVGLIVNDILNGKGVAVVDPHGELIDDALQFIPDHRKKDVIIFDPADTEYPFCFNPLDIKSTESKQILAKGFIDIFKKFFGANWNSMLEHVLRMIFLALLDKPGSTLFDIIRALTDKDFRYEMIEQINDDVVRNFWTNEFAGWSQQFNTQAIMPILNKIGQLLSIDMLKNIFASKQNKLDFREAMDSSKLVFIKLSKGKLQEEIMGFLGAMFITKIYQTAMGRAGTDKEQRTNFFLYVDEFQNFATETFSEILSEARKYGLGMTVAHQFVKQIPKDISDALFGNVGTLVSFRISADDAGFIKSHFAPFLETYDLENLNQREMYCKTQVKGQTKDPFSLKSSYFPDPKIDKDFIADLYRQNHELYCRSLEEAKTIVQEEQKDVLTTIEEFVEPLI
ncbi:MAG TPA: type IV secretion system DNA-binding domain-containing protein [Candidatus Absconditabacterales bacterium]|nr:type IV secretion system DNA-binding domain-containing protein [Candidatus Absconditabacterales bacterium]